MLQIKEILEGLGYKIKDAGSYLQTVALYRSGDNPTALAIYPKSNLVIDFVTNEKFSIDSLIKRTLNISDNNQYEQWKLNNNIVIEDLYQNNTPKLSLKKTVDSSYLNDMVEDYSYFNGRGISTETLKKFKGGFIPKTAKNKLKNRFVVPIFNSKQELIGLVGRAIDNNTIPKVKNIGVKNDWLWPAFLNHKTIKEKSSVILTESPWDILSLFECGIENCLCLFGTEMGLALLNYLIKINLKNIVISTNNDRVGQEAAEKLKRRLLKYFNQNQVCIKYPSVGYKDFNEVLASDGGINKVNMWYELVYEN